MNQGRDKKNLNDYEQFAMSYHKDSFTHSKNKQVNPKASYTKTTSDKKTIPMGGYDNLIPNKLGNMVDSVFGKLDSFVNTVLGEDKGVKSKKSSANIKQSKQPTKPAPTKPSSSWGKGTTKEYVNQSDDYFEDEDFEYKNNTIKPIEPINIKTTKKVNYNYQYEEDDDEDEDDEEDNYKNKKALQATLKKTLKTIPKIPRISRTTPISELNLDYKILTDPDLVKYFDQMKLYEYSIIEGGLCNMTVLEAATILSKGLWGNKFNIKFEELKLSLGLKPIDIAKSRFKGMLPVYKAYGWKFNSQEELKKAIEDDINSFLSTGKGNPVFHKFTYKIISKK